MHLRKVVRNVVGTLMFATWTNCSATNGYVANAFGLKSAGMGGVAAAVAQEPLGGATNPATMVFLDNRWQLSGAWFSPRGSASRVGSGPAGLDGAAASENTNFLIPEFGINWRNADESIAVGLSVYGNAINTKYPSGQISPASACAAFNPSSTAHNLLCGDGKLGVDTPQYLASPYVAGRFKGHAFGIAPIIAYQRFESYGLQALSNPSLSNNVASVTNRGHHNSWGVGVRVGYVAEITGALRFGLAYASRVRLRRFDKYEGLLAESGRFDIPQSFLAGLAFTPTKKWLIAMDYQRINYEQIHSLSNASRLLVACVQGQRDNCLGAGTRAGLGWRDIDVWKVGIQWELDPDWTVRAGYSHSGSPVTPADVTLNILAPAIAKDHYSAGFTYRFRDALSRGSNSARSEVTAAFVYAKKNSLTGPSLFTAFGAPPTTVETISMTQYLFGLAYSRPF